LATTSASCSQKSLNWKLSNRRA